MPYIKKCKVLVRDFFPKETVKEGQVVVNKSLVEDVVIQVKRMLICDLCNKSYTTKMGLEYHMRNFHLNAIIGQYKDSRRCGFCEKFVQREQFQDHIKHNHQFLRCEICLKAYYDEKSLLRHKKTHDDNLKYTCDICNYNCVLYYNMKRHILGVHLGSPSRSKCEYCGKMICSDHLKRHINNVHKNLRNSKCHVCKKTFYDKHKLRRHLDTVHVKQKNHVCSICTKKFALKEYLARHLNGAHGASKHTCNKCERTFSFSENLKRHLKSHEKSPFCCTTLTCMSMFKTKAALDKHVKVHHANRKGARFKRHPCDECDKDFSTRYCLKLHKMSVHQHLQYQCHFCGNQYRQRHSIGKHLFKYHVDKS